MSIRLVPPDCSEKPTIGSLDPAVVRVLETLEPGERLPFLAWVEQRARQAGDLEMLRLARECRLSIRPPKTA